MFGQDLWEFGSEVPGRSAFEHGAANPSGNLYLGKSRYNRN